MTSIAFLIVAHVPENFSAFYTTIILITMLKRIAHLSVIYT